jgi:DNA-binding XRE family transcriptional regulator
MTLKEVREKNKLSQAAFAKTIEVSSSAIASIESGRMKASQKICDKVKEVYGETIEPEVKKVQEAEKKVEAKVEAAEKKVEAAEKKVEAAEKKVAEVEKKAANTAKKVEKKAADTKVKAEKTKAKAAETAAKTKAAAEKAEKKVKKGAKAAEAAAAGVAKKALPKKAEVVIQSPLGGEITPEEILAKIGAADKVYVRVDVNKAYWVKGDEAGSVDLW